MAEYTGAKTTALLDGAVQTKADVTFNGSRARLVSDVSGEEAWAENDVIWLARLPSSAHVTELSRLVHEAFGTSVTADVGIFNQSGKSDFTDDDDALAVDVDISSAGDFYLFEGIDLANKNKRLWELAGASADFKEDVDIKLTLKDANPTDNVRVAWALVYAED